MVPKAYLRFNIHQPKLDVEVDHVCIFFFTGHQNFIFTTWIIIHHCNNFSCFSYLIIYNDLVKCKITEICDAILQMGTSMPRTAYNTF